MQKRKLKFKIQVLNFTVLYTFFILGVKFEYDMSRSNWMAAAAIVSFGVFKQVSQRNSSPHRSGFSTIWKDSINMIVTIALTR